VSGEIAHADLFGEDFYTLFYGACFDRGRSRETYRKDAKFIWFEKALDLIEQRVSPGALLEVGCATGFFLDYARTRGWAVQGVEVSEYAAGEAARIYDLDVFWGDIREADFAPNRFDAVALFDVVEHVLDPVSFLEAVLRVLKPGGQLVLITDNDASLIAGLTGMCYRMSFGQVHYPCARAYPIFNVSYFSGSLLKELLERLGFEVVYTEKMDQAVSRTRVSGWGERVVLHTLYGLGRMLNAQYQIFLVCQKAKLEE
ncbi:MAG: class I SAM-dependent methyltransferase, partial [bacterium]|nr:class I SAM-dependent methyltransferase [bacterium]